MNIIKKTANSVANKAAETSRKYKIKSKLKKQYEFTEDQLKEIFTLWRGKTKELKTKIKDVEESNEGLCEYTAMGNEIGKLLYDALTEKK